MYNVHKYDIEVDSDQERINACPRGYDIACSECPHVRIYPQMGYFHCLDMRLDNIWCRSYFTVIDNGDGEDGTVQYRMLLNYNELVLEDAVLINPVMDFHKTVYDARDDFDSITFLNNTLYNLFTRGEITLENHGDTKRLTKGMEI